MADRSDDVRRIDGATVCSEDLASEDSVKILTSSHDLESHTANAEGAMEILSTSGTSDIDGNPHSNAMNNPTPNGTTEANVSTTGDGIERACTGCESVDETEAQSNPSGGNAKCNEVDLTEPCAKTTETETTGDIETLPSEGLAAKPADVDVKSMETQPNIASVDGSLEMTHGDAPDEPTRGTVHVQPTKEAVKTQTEEKPMNTCHVGDDTKETLGKQSNTSNCDGGSVNEDGGSSIISTPTAEGLAPIDESQKPLVEEGCFKRCCPKADGNISKSVESIVSDVLVDLLTKVCDDHHIKVTRKALNGVSETCVDQGSPGVGDEKSIVGGLVEEDAAAERSKGSKHTEPLDNNPAATGTAMETSVSTADIITQNTDEDANILALAKQVVEETIAPIASEKFCRIGPAQKVSVAPKSAPRVKRTEKFVVKNVSKVSKIFRVSNLNYKIKPVLKNASSLSCPVVYLGELAFIDLEDFVTEGKKPSDRNQVILNYNGQHGAPNSDNPYAESPNMVVKRTSSFSLPDFVRSKGANDPHSDLKVLTSEQTSSNVQFPNHSGFRIIARQVPRSVISNASKPAAFEKLATVMPKFTMPQQTQQTVKSFKYEFANNALVSQGNVMPTVSRAVNVQVPLTISQKIVPNRKLMPHKKIVTLPTTVVPKTQASAINVFPPYTPSHSVPAKAMPTLHGSKLLVVNTTKCQNTTSGNLTAVVDGDLNSNAKRPISFKTIGNNITDSKKGQVSANKQAGSGNIKVVGSVIKKATVRGNDQAGDLGKGKVAVKSIPPVLQPSLEIQRKFLPGSLRSGVEVSFEDGVRHFITNLSKMMHLDDEPISSWSELKKGMTVAAKWTDGQYYDAHVVACYFPASKKMQPVVKLQSLPTSAYKNEKKSDDKKQTQSVKSNSNAAKTVSKSKRVGCTQCRAIFDSLSEFRNHQKTKCKGRGVIVPESATEITDAMIEAVTETKKKPEKEKDTETKNKDAKTDIRSAVSRRQATITPVKDEKVERKKSNAKVSSVTKAVKRMASKDSTSPPRKKSKAANVIAKQRMQEDNFGAIFKVGTKFLHRWQLDNGGSKWYQGEVMNITHDRGSFLNWEFEVSYKGEEDNYLLKLYEDFPTDIRIIG